MSTTGFRYASRLKVDLDLEGEIQNVGTLAWNVDERRSYIQFSADFAGSRLNLSPFKLRMDNGAFAQAAPHLPFSGLHGLFNDSLPDGWGRLLVDRYLQRRDVDFRQLTPLDRLSFVGTKGMGALTYTPEHSLSDETAENMDLDWFAEQTAIAQTQVDAAEIEILQGHQGGSGGARPKIIVGFDPATNRVCADTGNDLPRDFQPWIVKFKSTSDPAEIGAEEYAYSLMLKAAGIDMPDTRLIKTAKGGRFFAIKRFDRTESGRLHIQTASAIYDIDHQVPASVDYEDLLQITRLLTRDLRSVSKMFHRMVFNVFARNRDDHVKNHAFMMDRTGQWKPTPAYDVTFSQGPGGYHNLGISGEALNPGQKDILRVAESVGIDKEDALSVIDRVKTVIGAWPRFAEESGLSNARTKEIDQVLNGALNP